MITKEVDYAIRAVLCLSSHREERLSAAELSKRMAIPYRFLRNICRLLVEAGIVESRRGNGGGLCLLQSPETLSLYDIVQAVNPRSCVLNACLLGGESRCKRDGLCPVHDQLAELQTTVDTRLKEIRFDQLMSA